MQASLVVLILLSVGSCWAGSWETSIDEFRLQGNRNDDETISREVNEVIVNPEVSRKAWGGNRRVNITAEVKAIDELDPRLVTLRLHSEGQSEAFLNEVGKKLMKYVRLRLKGHTTEYAHWVVFSGINQPPEQLNGRFPFLATAIDEIGVPWIRHDINKTFVYPNLDPKRHLLVVDGELAWIYSTIEAEPGTPSVECIDGSEFTRACSEL